MSLSRQAVGAGAFNATEIVDKMHTAERSLPNPLLPDFWAVLALAGVVVLNSLVWFIQAPPTPDVNRGLGFADGGSRFWGLGFGPRVHVKFR